MAPATSADNQAITMATALVETTIFNAATRKGLSHSSLMSNLKKESSASTKQLSKAIGRCVDKGTVNVVDETAPHKWYKLADATKKDLKRELGAPSTAAAKKTIKKTPASAKKAPKKKAAPKKAKAKADEQPEAEVRRAARAFPSKTRARPRAPPRWARGLSPLSLRA